MTNHASARFCIKPVIYAALLAVVALLGSPSPCLEVSSYPFGAIKSISTNEKVVALTYDDGPDPVTTPKLIKILDHYHIKATFFMVGSRMEKYPDIVKEVLNHGHLIANHTYTHPWDIKRDSAAQMASEMKRCQATILKLTSKRAHLFRPPRGLVGGGVTTVASAAGYKTILWTICADHHDAPTPELMAKRVLDHIIPGAIVLAHDGSIRDLKTGKLPDRSKDIAATPLIIQGLQKMGYRFVTVDQLLDMESKPQPASSDR